MKKSCCLHANLQHPPQQTNPDCAFRQCSQTKISSKDPMKGKCCWSPRQGALPCAEHCPNTTGTGRSLKSSLTAQPQAAAPLPRLAHTISTPGSEQIVCTAELFSSTFQYLSALGFFFPCINSCIASHLGLCLLTPVMLWSSSCLQQRKA